MVTGAAGAFDPSGREVTRAMIRILDHLRVNYRVLGCRERCTGDPARRLGEEELWRELAEHNQRVIADSRVGAIVTHCPHCFHSLKNEYPKVQWYKTNDGRVGRVFGVPFGGGGSPVMRSKIATNRATGNSMPMSLTRHGYRFQSGFVQGIEKLDPSMPIKRWPRQRAGRRLWPVNRSPVARRRRR